MGKKITIIVSVIVVLFIALFFALNYKNNKALEGENPYGTNDLDQATIDQLDDPLYGNQILPDDLMEQVESGEPTTVYFYSPTCVYCQQTTPYLVPLTEEMDVDMKKLNLLEFGNEAAPFAIRSTPTLVYYENGEEVARLEGQYPEEQYEQFFNEYVHATE
ncbi:thioredoxin family protein [Oceanobacillus alkalisoli]|uniref:thioredoxin family protein n=1 Tax=Oceanobacillus alkalisoli TaxID=2925113 RepID=UPI001EF0B52E|nr:thioredoxin family protein [Oceanobacillus alkalisoli]MCF3942037.1 thioredoxin family protein [Oceanobacillus alkalisoli]MCG5102010.1 thioredoxin family protein [Oceanobacillus alkalisoli]